MKILILPILVTLLVLSFSIHDAHAVTAIDLKDQASCQAAPLSGTWTVTTSTCTVTNLSLNSGDSLTIDNSVSPNITLAITGTLFNNFGTITNSGTIVNSGLIASIGTIINNQGSTINNNLGGIIDNGGTIANNGVITNSGTITNIGSFTNNLGGTIVINSGGVLANTNSLTVPGGGTITIPSGGTITNSGTITNNGTVNTDGGTISNSGTITNNVTVNNTGGAITNSGIITNNGNFIITGITNEFFGVINNNSGGTMTIEHNGSIGNSGQIINSGTFTNAGYLSQDHFGRVTNNYMFTNTGTMCPNVSCTGTWRSGAINNNAGGTLTNSGTIQFLDVLTNAGTMITNTPGLISNTGVMNNSGTFIFNSVSPPGTNNMGNYNTISNSGTIKIVSGVFTNTELGIITNTGTITVNNGGMLANFGTIINCEGTINSNNPILPHRYVTCTTTTLSSVLNTSAPGLPVAFTATVSPSTVTGTVTFLVDGLSQPPVAVSGGHAVFVLSSLAVGSHIIVAEYSGDNIYATSTSNTVTLDVLASTKGKVIGDGHLGNDTHFEFSVKSKDGISFNGNLEYDDKSKIKLDSKKMTFLSVNNSLTNATFVGQAKLDDHNEKLSTFLVQVTDTNKPQRHDNEKETSDTFSIIVMDSTGTITYQNSGTISGHIEIDKLTDKDNVDVKIGNNDK